MGGKGMQAGDAWSQGARTLRPSTSPSTRRHSASGEAVNTSTLLRYSTCEGVRGCTGGVGCVRVCRGWRV